MLFFFLFEELQQAKAVDGFIVVAEDADLCIEVTKGRTKKLDPKKKKWWFPKKLGF